MSDERFVVLNGNWGHDPRFVPGFEFTRDEVPEHYQFDQGLRKGAIAPVPTEADEDEPIALDDETKAESTESTESEDNKPHKKHKHDSETE